MFQLHGGVTFIFCFYCFRSSETTTDCSALLTVTFRAMALDLRLVKRLQLFSQAFSTGFTCRSVAWRLGQKSSQHVVRCPIAEMAFWEKYTTALPIDIKITFSVNESS